MNADTPRTEAEIERSLGDPSPEFCRGLERELDELRAHAERLQNAIDQFTVEVAELRKDKARLDWLDENMSYHGGGDGGTYSFSTPADVECGMLRAAIDAAIAQRPAAE